MMSKREQVHIGRDSGRVKVFVRIRPLNKEENINKIKSIWKVSEEKGQISLLSDSSKQPDKIYHFDHVFSSTKTNQQVCDKLSQPIVDSALNGFNGTLMAYGQTGTGKTHTLMAPDGIAQNIIYKVFDQIQSDGSHYYKVSASYLQIYQEKIHDLLNFNNKVELNIREKPKSGIFVENLTEYVIRSSSEALSLLAFGKKRLVFAETKMNRTSSRSHSVFQLTIEKTPRREKLTNSEVNESKRFRTPIHTKNAESVVQMIELEDDLIVKGKIHLCDLAGSERIKKTHAYGERLCEAQHINSSLLELGNVIQALADEKSTHIPFRNSILTRLLQESLGGNCKTSLIVCIAPGLKDLSETKSTLNFGSRAMKIENIAYVNVEVDYKRLSESLLKRLEEQECELHRLRQEQSQIMQCTEKIVLERRLEEICKQSELIIKSLKSTHDIEIKALDMKIKELMEGMKLKDEQIEELLYENNILKDERATEEKIAKLLLVNEIASLEILSATEFERIYSSKAQYNNHHQDIVEAMLEHCQMMLEGAKIFLREPNQVSPKTIDSRESKISQIQCTNSGNVWKEMNVSLIKSKKILDIQLKKVFQKEYHTQDLETPKNSVLWDLCSSFIDKGFLASHMAVENHELRQENKLLMEKIRLSNIRKEEEMSEDLAEKLQRTLEDSTDVDKTLSGFEFTLSKIEKILSDKTNLERNEPEVDKKEISAPRNQLNLNERVMSRNLRNPANARKGISNEEWTRNATDEGNIPLSKRSSKKEKEHLIKSITKKQEENLAQFFSSEENLIEVKYKKKSSMKMSSEDFVGPTKNEEVLQKGSFVNKSELSKDEEYLTSAIISEAKELSDTLDQYLSIHDVIKEVKTEIEKQKLNRQKEDKTECKKSKFKTLHSQNSLALVAVQNYSSNHSIKERREITSKSERTLINDLRTQGYWITNVMCEPNTPCEFQYETTVFPCEYFSMLPLPCLCLEMPPCYWKGGLIEIRNDGAHWDGQCNPDYPMLPKCVSMCFSKPSKDGIEIDKHENYYNELTIDTGLTLYKGNGKNHLHDLCNGYDKDCDRPRHQTTKRDFYYVKKDELKSRTEAEESCEGHVSNVCTDREQLTNANDEEKKVCDNFDLVMKCSKSCNSFTGAPNLSSNGPKKKAHLEEDFEVNTNGDRYTLNLHERETYKHAEQSQSPCACIPKESDCNSTDEELNLRIAAFSDEIHSDYEIGDKRQCKQGKRKENNENFSIANCSMLEVQIASGNEGYYCYGDSFVSPLSKPKFSDEKEESPALYLDELPTTSMDDCKIKKSDNVIIKTPWSLSKWLWGKRTKAKVDEETVTVCQ